MAQLVWCLSQILSGLLSNFSISRKILQVLCSNTDLNLSPSASNCQGLKHSEGIMALKHNCSQIPRSRLPIFPSSSLRKSTSGREPTRSSHRDQCQKTSLPTSVLTLRLYLVQARDLRVAEKKGKENQSGCCSQTCPLRD